MPPVHEEVAEPGNGTLHSATRIYAAVAAVLTGVLLLVTPFLARQVAACGPQPCDRQAWAELYLVLGPGALGAFLTVYLLAPLERMSKRWGRKASIAIASALALALAGFILHFGNKQFGAYDFSILIDTGWRLMQGQQPYRDFVCTLPPGFYLGLKYAFHLFGVNWNAQLWATALFAIATFGWLYGLLNLLLEARTAALLTAFTIECSAMLTLDFWWYNNITAAAAAIFLLSCLAYLRRPQQAGVQISYAVSLMLISLMKPNVAGPLIAGGALLTFAGTQRKIRLFLLTGLALVTSIAFLMLNGISISGLLGSYAAAAQARGGLSTFGFRGMRMRDLGRVVVCFSALLTPLIALWPRWREALRKRDRHIASQLLLFPLAACTSAFAMFTNGELKDVEWCVLIACGAALLFGRGVQHRNLKRFYAALLCSLILSDVYMGAVRLRVEGIGPHLFFEWHDTRARIDNPFFRDLRTSQRFRAVVNQTGAVVRQNPTPVFFGPRMEFAYAAFQLPSPKGLPVWWHPGTSFAVREEGKLRRAWETHRFATLIFLKDDFTYYSPSFMNLLARDYECDERNSELTVFHLRASRK